MIYNQAKRIALKCNGQVNACREYKDAYHFYIKDYDGDGDNGVIVLKGTGKVINFVTFIWDYKPERDPKELKF